MSRSSCLIPLDKRHRGTYVGATTNSDDIAKAEAGDKTSRRRIATDISPFLKDSVEHIESLIIWDKIRVLD